MCASLVTRTTSPIRLLKKLSTFGPLKTTFAGSLDPSARTELFTQASRTLSSSFCPATLCPIIALIEAASAGLPAAVQFFQMLTVLSRFISTLFCGDVAANNAVKRGESAPNTFWIALAEAAYQPFLGVPNFASAA